jgi:hypothetical protein
VNVSESRWYKLLVAGVLLALLLIAAGPVHPDDESQSDDHCAVCHVRHVSGLTPISTAISSSPLVVAQPAAVDVSQDEQNPFHELHLSRGPPA